MIRAAGAVLYRLPAPSGGVEVALVHRPRHDDWSLPKGKVDDGETWPFTAVREIHEETGYRCRLGPLLGDVEYPLPEGHTKRVRYWAALALDGSFVENDEVDELRWLPLDEAAGLVSYAEDRRTLKRFAEVGAPTTVLLLVRHAKAGSRSQWDGDDDLRPLSGKGRDQARQLVGLLPLFGPERIATAPPVRCRDTVAPFATTAGLPVGDEPLLGEDGYWEDPDVGLARVRELALVPGVTVVSSQGGVIPDVVEKLTGVPDRPSKKASTWVLSFVAGELRAADYYERPTG